LKRFRLLKAYLKVDYNDDDDDDDDNSQVESKGF
jgi:hypothetical protein